MKNKAIREALAEHGMKQWQLAEYLGISEWTLTRRLRRELSEEETEKILHLIEERANG